VIMDQKNGILRMYELPDWIISGKSSCEPRGHFNEDVGVIHGAHPRLMDGIALLLAGGRAATSSCC
jgi:hypothetical protein